MEELQEYFKEKLIELRKNYNVEYHLCDCKIHKDSDTHYYASKKGDADVLLSRKYFVYFCFVFAVIFVVWGLAIINSSKYNSYKEYYEECMRGYDDNKYAEMTSGLLFKGSYRLIAEEYEEMANDAMKEIWKYCGQALALFVMAFVSMLLGLVLNKKGKGVIYEK